MADFESQWEAAKEPEAPPDEPLWNEGESPDNYAPIRPVFERGDHAELADRLLVALAPVREHVVCCDGAIWVYHPVGGWWRRMDREPLRRIVKGFAGADKRMPEGKVGPLKITSSAVEGAITLACAEVYEKEFFDSAKPGVAFKDSFVTVADGKVARLPHSPDNRARSGFGFAYDPTAKTELYESFYESVFGDASEDEKAARTMVQEEFAGACMLGMATSYQQALVNYGPGGTGKSEDAKIKIAAHPSTAVASLPPHRWGERFDLARLVGVTLNVVGELPATELVSTEAFKAVITGDQVAAERKHQDGFDFRPRAGHVFLANELPATRDVTHAFFRRFVICPFTRDMVSAPTHRKEAGAHVVEHEHQGIVARAIEGACRLQRQGKYTAPPSGAAILEKWKREADSVTLFVDERCERLDLSQQTANAGTRAGILYGRYREWADKSGYKAVSAKTFRHRMDGLKLWCIGYGDANYYPVRTREVSL